MLECEDSDGEPRPAARDNPDGLCATCAANIAARSKLPMAVIKHYIGQLRVRTARQTLIVDASPTGYVAALKKWRRRHKAA